MTRDYHSSLAEDGASPPNRDYARLLFAAIFRSSSDAIICTDLEGYITGWNESATLLFGYSSGEMIGTTFSRIVPEESHAQESELLNNLSAQCRQRYEAFRHTKAGTPVRVLAAISAVEDDAGVVIGALRVEREIQTKPAEEEAHSTLAAIVESSDDAIVGKNLDGIITSWNQAASRLFGYTAEEMIGQPVLKIIPDDLRSEEADILKEIRSGERIEHYETRRIRKERRNRRGRRSPFRLLKTATERSSDLRRSRARSPNARRWSAF